MLDEPREREASVVAAFDARLLQYKTVLQSRINREQIRQSFQLFLGRFLVPTQLYPCAVRKGSLQDASGHTQRIARWYLQVVSLAQQQS